MPELKDEGGAVKQAVYGHGQMQTPAEGRRHKVLTGEALLFR